jgi:hypothetical protein
MREELQELELLERLQRLQPAEKLRLAEYRRLLGKILVLPGFELTATLGFHVIGVFAPDTPVRDLEHLLLSFRVPPDQLDKGSATVGATVDVLTAYQAIDEAGGLTIAAHANSSNGVAMRGLNFGGQTKISYTQDPHLHALEVTDLDQKGRRSTAAFFNGSKPEYPRRMHCIQGSDSHFLRRDPTNAKNLGVGERATDVLLEEVSFQALKGVFSGNDFARTRPHTTHAAVEFDHVQQAREDGSNIVQEFHESMTQRGGRLYAIIADVCAFANTNGGTLYIGLGADPKAPPKGVENTSQAITDISSAIERMITPHLDCAVDTQVTAGKTVLRIMVPHGDNPPYAIDDNKIYVRDEAETSLAVRDEIVQLVLRGQPGQVAAAAASREAVAAAAQPAPAEPAEVERTQITTERPGVQPPRTGVEIVATEERDGHMYHTMRDLRNGSVVTNVTRASSRKLWHYAISERETGRADSATAHWVGDLGLLKKSQKGKAVHYDLAHRTPEGTRVYYGVTEDGIHGEWRRVVGRADEE